MGSGIEPTLVSRSTVDGLSRLKDGSAMSSSIVARSLPEECDVCRRFFTEVATFANLRAVKLYRVRFDLTPAVPSLPCLDHEAMLHEGIAPHAAAYVEDHETGELHEIVLVPSRQRVEIDTASTLHEHSDGGRARLLNQLRERFPDFQYVINTPSWLRGDRRVARACRAQVSLREVLLGVDLEHVAAALNRLRTIGALMEKHSRVASWSVRTVTGPFLAVVGFLVYQGLARLAPEIGVGAVSVLQAGLVGTAGALFLYFGLKAVHLTEMANRVWKRATEYGLIIEERERLGSLGRNEGPHGDTDPEHTASTRSKAQ
jgi:hypothetical protein